MTEDQRQWAIDRIRAKRALWVHLAVYILVNALLLFIWAINSTDYFWPMWPMLGWGIGVVAHAVAVGIGGSEITEERITREIESRATARR